MQRMSDMSCMKHLDKVTEISSYMIQADPLLSVDYEILSLMTWCYSFTCSYWLLIWTHQKREVAVSFLKQEFDNTPLLFYITNEWKFMSLPHCWSKLEVTRNTICLFCWLSSLSDFNVYVVYCTMLYHYWFFKLILCTNRLKHKQRLKYTNHQKRFN